MITIDNKKHIEDLFKNIDFKLADLLSHIKILANFTSEKTDFEIDYNDVNSFAMTMYDKLSETMNVLEDLKQNVENL